MDISSLKKMVTTLDKKPGITQPLQALTGTKAGQGIFEFQKLFSEALASIQGAADSNNTKLLIKKDQRKGNVTDVDEAEKAMLSSIRVQAAPPAGVNQPALDGAPETLNRVPLQLFLDKSLQALSEVSKDEMRVNDLIQGFVNGDVSEDEVIIETSKLNLTMTLITTIIQSAVTTFKEIQNIPV